MILLRGKVEMDHKDPNAAPEDFDKRSNHQLVHTRCNSEKGAASIMQQTKMYHRTVAELV